VFNRMITLGTVALLGSTCLAPVEVTTDDSTEDVRQLMIDQYDKDVPIGGASGIYSLP